MKTSFLLFFLALFASVSLLMTPLASANFGTGVEGLSNQGLFNDVNPADGTDEALNNLELFLSRVIGGLTTLSSFFFLLYFVLGAFSWVTAGGDQSKISKARDQMIQGALGMIVIVGAYAVIGTIGTVLGLKLLNPADQLRSVFMIDQAPGLTQPGQLI